jgi:hypothetical protein
MTGQAKQESMLTMYCTVPKPFVRTKLRWSPGNNLLQGE